LSFDFFVRYGFSGFNLVQPFPDSRQKLQPLSDGIQAGIIRQALDAFQGKLPIAQSITAYEKIRNCNSLNIAI
jgi:hypothetical protein